MPNKNIGRSNPRTHDFLYNSSSSNSESIDPYSGAARELPPNANPETRSTRTQQRQEVSLINTGAKKVSHSRGSAFAAVFKIGEYGIRGLSLTIGLPFVGLGLLMGGATLLTSTIVKNAGRLTLGALGYAIGAVADQMTGSTTKAGRVSKAFSLPTDAAAMIILLGYLPFLIMFLIGGCGTFFALSESEFNTFKNTIELIESAYNKACNQLDEKVEALLQHRPRSVFLDGYESTHPLPLFKADSANSFVRLSHKKLTHEEELQQSRGIAYSNQANSTSTTSPFSREYLEIQKNALLSLTTKFESVDWKLSENGEIIGKDKQAKGHSSPVDKTLTELIGNSFTRSGATIKITNPSAIIKLGDRIESLEDRDLFTSDYRKHQQKAADYLNSLKYPNQTFEWKTTPEGGLSCERSFPSDKDQKQPEEDIQVVNSMKNHITTAAGTALTSLNLFYHRRGNFFNGAITDPTEILKLADIKNSDV